MSVHALLLLPLLAGLVLAVVWQSGLFSNPIVFARADVGSLLVIIGGMISLASEAFWTFRSRERRRAEHLLRQIQQEQADSHRRFVDRLNHEIKNPLTAIRAGLANADTRDNAPALASVRAQVDRLARLSADLRKLTDLETAPLEMEAVDLCQVLQELVTSVRSRPEASCYHLHLNLPQAPWPIPPIVGDRDLILLALHNLVDNAVKFSARGAMIEIRAFEDGAMEAIEVADTGPGVSEEDLRHLGEELYRGPTAMNVEGSGLGLATVAALQTENARLAQLLAAQVTPTPLPPALGRITYVQGGDLWVKALTNGRPLRLTTDGRNREPQPRWSPSGEWLAFRTERQVILQPDAECDIPTSRRTRCDSVPVLQKQVWLIGEDGGHARVLNRGFSVEAFAWSPARDWLAFVSENAGLQMENADGTSVITLIAPATQDRQAARVGRIAWNPNGTSIAYEWIAETADQTPIYQGIWKIALDGRERVELFVTSAPDKNDLVLAGWTAQGKDILFWSDERETAARDGGRMLWSVPSDSRSADGEPVQQSSEPMLAYPDFIATAPALSEQGRRGALALTVGADYATWANKRIEMARLLTPKGLAAISPTWSPDGTRLAYSAMPAYENLNPFQMTFQELMQRRLWITDLADQDRTRQLTDSNSYRDERPLWSIGGSHILFARIDTKGRATLWIIPADGSVPAMQVVDELTPTPDSFGYHGHVDWDNLYDWWRGSISSGL